MDVRSRGPRVLLSGALAIAVMAACGRGLTASPQPGDDAGAPGDEAGPTPDAGAGPEASSDASSGDSGDAHPACPPTCGPDAGETCCASLAVSGGTFFRSYDGVTAETLGGDCCTDRSWPATVSDFRLDRFEVTIGRYRPFVNAVAGGWHPPAASGKQTHLNGGQGVVDSSGEAGITYETGWDPSWNDALASSIDAPDARACPEIQEMDWTASPGPNDDRPISCVTWWAAYAFCIWDGGFLPTEAEWNYAASGGAQQRVFAWGSQSIDCTLANFDWCLAGDAGVTATGTYVSVVGAYSPAGDGLFGQADLVGNVSEWTLDSYADYVVPCVDCAYLGAGLAVPSEKVMRGSAFDQSEPYINPAVSARDARTADVPLSTGVRCARVP
jgi:sulfatase modifying factor 1